ncbi:hypothetical protein, partial [Escherichia coli]|uniref:hypothetical protein n=1 Tax=Escherichia coli TaxID=562 RepID=UPI0009495E0B
NKRQYGAPLTLTKRQLNLFIMQNGIAHNGLILLWRMREGKHLCPGKTTLSDHAVLYLPVSTFVGTGFFIHPL